MFDELFGEQAKKSAAIDTYLNRMEKILTVKKMAKDLDEPSLSDAMDEFVKALSKAAGELAEKGVSDEKKDA